MRRRRSLRGLLFVLLVVLLLLMLAGCLTVLIYARKQCDVTGT